MLLCLNDDGSIRKKVVAHDCSVLNIERDLRDHMNEYPYSDDWLAQVRDYINQRLDARRDARKFGAISVPVRGGVKWEVDVAV